MFKVEAILSFIMGIEFNRIFANKNKEQPTSNYGKNKHNAIPINYSDHRKLEKSLHIDGSQNDSHI